MRHGHKNRYANDFRKISFFIFVVWDPRDYKHKIINSVLGMISINIKNIKFKELFILNNESESEIPEA